MCRRLYFCLLDVIDCNARHIFHCPVWYHTLSLHCARIRSSGIVLIPQATFVPNFVSFVASIAELSHREKSHTQSLTHSLSRFSWCPGNWVFRIGITRRQLETSWLMISWLITPLLVLCYSHHQQPAWHVKETFEWSEQRQQAHH